MILSLGRAMPFLCLLQGTPVFKKIMIAFYAVAGVAAVGVLIWYFIKKREQ